MEFTSLWEKIGCLNMMNCYANESPKLFDYRTAQHSTQSGKGLIKTIQSSQGLTLSTKKRLNGRKK